MIDLKQGRLNDSWEEMINIGAMELGISLNSNQLHCISFHGSELIKWNKKFNITSITDPFEIAVKHFIDCLAIVPHISDNAKVLDIGSGGGFPGLPLKIVRPSIEIMMIDSSRKKISFLNYMIRSLGMTGINAMHTRCEDLSEKENFQHRFDFVVSRAFTSLDRFFDLSLPFLSTNGIIFAMKGKNPEQEMLSMKQKKLCMENISYTLPMGKYNRSIIKIKPVIKN